MAQAHAFHRLWHIVNFQDFVVVGRNEAIEGVADKAEAEMGGSQSPGLLGCDQTRFAVGIVFPEAIRCGFDSTIGIMLEQFTQTGFD